MRPLYQRLQRCGFNGDGRTDRASLQRATRLVRCYSVDFCTFADDELEEVALDATSDRLRYDLSPAGRYSDTLAREMQQILLGLIGFDSVL